MRPSLVPLTDRHASALALACLACTPTASADGPTSETDTGAELDSETTETGFEPEPASWRPVLHAGQDIGALMSVWGSSPAEVFAVGGQPEPGGGRVLHNDGGDEWIAEPLPAGVGMLNWVYGVDGSVWSVGLGGAIVRREASGWVAEPSPTDRVLWGVWGASADELWAVGGDGVTDDPLLLRREGATGEWAIVELPGLGTNANALFKVWGAAADDVWAVGDAGATVHWDGQAWTAQPAADGVDLISVWGSAAEGVIAVGGRANGRVERLVGGSWIGQMLEIPGLNGIWVDAEGGATAVGVQGTIIRLEPGGFDYEFEPAGTPMVLHAVFGFAGGPRLAVGGSLLMAPPFVGVIVKFD
jgi:hypothetical protein